MDRFLACIALLTILVTASPQVTYPLNLQFPPVARVGEHFSFQFAPTTFSSGSNTLQYSLIGNPSWLSLDGNSRTLSGTPKDGDEGTAAFTITAAGQAGAVANMESQLIVSRDTAPTTKSNVSLVLSTAGKLVGPRTVTVSPSAMFNISFPLDTFQSAGKKLSYVATLANHTPLPAWISFDAASIHFAGVAPPLESPESFEVLLMAWDLPGFASCSTSFTMTISKHSLFFDPFSRSMNITRGDEVHIDGLKQQLFVDDAPITDNEVESIIAELPSWLKFDKDTMEISGTAPIDATSQNISVTAQDRNGNIAQQTVRLMFEPELLIGKIGTIYLTPGELFEYQMPRTIFAEEGASVTVSLGTLGDYLHFDPATLLISGTVPIDIQPQNIECSVTAQSQDGDVRDTQAFHVQVRKAGNGVGIDPWDNGASNNSGKEHAKKDAVIVGSVIGAICGVALLCGLALCLRRRKKSIKSYINHRHHKSPKKSDISGPIMIPYAWPDFDGGAEDDVEIGKRDDDTYKDRAPEKAPKIDLHLSADIESVTDSIGDADTRILDDFEESSWGIQNDIAPSQHPHDSMKIPTELAKRRSSQRSDTFRKHKRQATTVYQDQIHRSSGLPVNRRITGVPQGRYTYFPSRSNTNFSRGSARRPLSMHSDTTTRCTSVCSTAPSAFPQPATARKHTTLVTMPTADRRSIRIVRSSFSDRRPIDERRNSYIRKRASAVSPFFSASTNASSSNYRSPPAFIAEVQTSPRAALSPITRNTIVRPDDTVLEIEENEASQPQKAHTSAIPFEIKRKDFPGSLRKNRTNRPLTAIPANRDRVEKSYARPTTTIHSRARNSFSRRDSSSRLSLRAYDLKASLNDLTGSKIFEDAEMSDSVYSDEEKDIEEAEKRSTVKPIHYTLPPLNLHRVDTARNRKRESTTEKRKTKRESRRELKRTSERDPTPYYTGLEGEHRGKENDESAYSLGQRSESIRFESKGKAKLITSDSTKVLTSRQSNPTAESKHKSRRTSTNRSSKPLAPAEPTKERHSRRSLHSRPQSQARKSIAAADGKKPREHSRQQSSSYPYFDSAGVETPDKPRASIDNALSPAEASLDFAKADARPSLFARDLSGNLTFYGGDDDEPTIEHLDSSSIGFRTSKGRISTTARQSRLASLHLSSQHHVPQVPVKSERRGTVIPISPTGRSVGQGQGQDKVEQDKLKGRVLSGELESESVKTPESEGQQQQQGQGGKTWGSLKSIMGRGSRWASGDYWDKQGKDDKVFI